MPAPLAPRDLTLPEPGSATARAVLSQAIGRLLHDLASAADRTPPGAQAEAAVLRGLAREALAKQRGALASALRRPTVGGLLRCLRNPDLAGREAAFVDLVAQLAFQLALSRALPGPVRLARFPALLMSIPSRLALTVGDGTRALVFENGRVTAEHAGGAAVVDFERPVSGGPLGVERPYHPLGGEMVLALTDNNPLAMVEAHPDKTGNAIDLGGRTVGEWTDALGAALGRIERHMPELRAEMDLFVSQVVPVGWDPVKHLSASYQEVVGTAYMTLHPSGMTLSEALIHEFSHNKLNALLDLDPVMQNALGSLHASPVRPDPRPLLGVLLAVHAFLPVARLYEQMIATGDPEAEHESFRGRFAEIRRMNHEGAALLLAEGRPTPAGEALLAEIRRWDEHYGRMG